MKKEVSFIAVLLGAFFTSFGMSFIWPLTSVYLHDDLQLKTTVWLMRDFESENFDPVVGVVGLARTVEKNGMVSSTSQKSAPEA